jgi:hypothetical protein
VSLNGSRAVRLASALRNLRESTWPSYLLTQGQLAKGLSSEGGRVAPATLSSWESTTNPKTPSAPRISAYARFFCTPRSLEGGAHLIPEDQLTPGEHDRYRQLESQFVDVLPSSPLYGVEGKSKPDFQDEHTARRDTVVYSTIQVKLARV